MGYRRYPPTESCSGMVLRQRLRSESGVSALPIMPPDEGSQRAPHLRTVPGRRRRPYDADFRAEAVRRATAPGAKVPEVAAELDVSPSTLRRWIRSEEAQTPTTPGPPAPPEPPASGPPSQEGSTPSDVETG